MAFIVETTHKGGKFWLKRTTWAFAEERAQRFETKEEAWAQLDKSKPFNAAAAFRNAVIKEVE
jgi:hypothetical protein